MSYQPPASHIAPDMVSSMGPWSSGYHLMIVGAENQGSPTANRAIYVAISLPVVCAARRLWWANGYSTAGNVDCGIYADSAGKPGARLVSTGSTAQSGTGVLQFVDSTDLVLRPGQYWLALVFSSGSAVGVRQTVSAGIDVVTMFNEESALPLPSTATPVEAIDGLYWLFGFTTTTSP